MKHDRHVPKVEISPVEEHMTNSPKNESLLEINKLVEAAVKSDESNPSKEEVKTETVELAPRRRKRNYENRGPLSGLPDFSKDKEFFYYLATANDPNKPGNIESLTQRDDDYEFATDANGEKISVTYGETTSYVLKKPMKYYIEDKKHEYLAGMKGMESAISQETKDRMAKLDLQFTHKTQTKNS